MSIRKVFKNIFRFQSIRILYWVYFFEMFRKTAQGRIFKKCHTPKSITGFLKLIKQSLKQTFVYKWK